MERLRNQKPRNICYRKTFRGFTKLGCIILDEHLIARHPKAALTLSIIVRLKIQLGFKKIK